MADKQGYSYSHSAQSSAVVRELKQRTDGVTATMQSRTSVTSSSTTLTSSSVDAANLTKIYTSAMDEFAADSQFMSSDLDVEEYGSLLDNSAAKHKMAIRPRKRHSDSRHFSPTRRLGGDDSSTNVTDTDDGVKKSRADELHAPRQQIYQRTRSGRLASVDPHAKREAVIRELVETEEEFVADMQHVVDKYYCQMDHPSTPRSVSNQRDSIFGPFKQIQDFHKSVLLEGLKYYANEPDKLGRTFLRLERDFDKHAQYYADEPKAQELLREDKVVKEFFEQYSHSISDTKHIGEYLKLPIQRINDFQVLLQDLITHSAELCEDTGDLLKAHEFMLGLPQRKADASLIENISGYRGNLHKLGRLLRQEWFTVTDSRGRARDRYLFLFKARILVTKVRRVTDDRNLFLLKDIIKIPDVEVNEKEADPPNFDLIHRDSRLVRYPLNLRAIPGRPVHQDWLTEIRK